MTEFECTHHSALTLDLVLDTREKYLAAAGRLNVDIDSHCFGKDS